MPRLALSVLPALCLAAFPARGQEPRPLKVDDIFALKDVADPRLSPDGLWVAYTVGTLDAKEDKSDTDVYLSPMAGGPALRATTSKKSERSPRFSPDGRWLAFLSAREGGKTQVYLMSRAGGEASKLTDYKASVSALAWSPDSTRLALVVSDVDPEAEPEEDEDEPAAASKDKTPRPIVLRRLQFKRDGEGYLREVRRHLHVFDVAAKSSFALTSGPFDDSAPAWSPDGKRLAFTSNRTWPDADASQNTDVFVVEARAGAVPRALTSWPGEDERPAFSPDGRFVAYVQGPDPKDLWYGASHLAAVPVEGGAPRSLTASLDRNVVGMPRFSPDGRSVYFLLEDGGNQHLCRVSAEGGPVDRVVAGEREVLSFDVGSRGELVVLESSAHQPPEVSSVAGPSLARLTRFNDDFLKGIRLGRVERFQAKGKDGTMVDGFLTLPPDHRPGTKIPTLLRIHGGPASQYGSGFEVQWQVLAAGGYAVVAPNPRGSTGYGTAFSRAIWADWGNKDFDDVMAAVDHVVGMGVADPDRLGVGGWSYGGMLTNYVIAKSDRFKAAVSGASIANYLAGYGTDHYQYEYEMELGLPWKTRQLWVDLSSPFFDVEKVTTPTLYMCGARDMNVPLLNTEQLYQALRRVGKVDTELVIYPDQWHGIETPSYQKDRLERYLAWYDRHLKPPSAGAAGRTPEATSRLDRPLYAPELQEETRKGLEESLARATADFVKDPDRADNVIWLGRRTAYLGRFREAVAVYTRGIARHPRDPRLYRHRGHRFITVREYDKAVADLDRAAALVAGKPDEVEPDGQPNPQNRPTSTLHFNIYYHLGLAHYLRGDFAAAERAYRKCLDASRGNPDRLVATSDWLYLTLRRLGRAEEARRVLEPIRADLEVIENNVYLNRLLMYKGERAPEELLRAGGDAVGLATYGYAVGAHHLLRGETDRARQVFAHVLRGPQWPAFGYAAAEAELARMRQAPR